MAQAQKGPGSNRSHFQYSRLSLIYLFLFLTYLFSLSLTSGRVPAVFKDSFVTPVIKKSGSDEGSPSSYRPISNLSIISKLLERLVARQLVMYLDTHRLLPATQSGFRRGHSTETTTIRVLSDLLDLSLIHI